MCLILNMFKLLKVNETGFNIGQGEKGEDDFPLGIQSVRTLYSKIV
jgi:hypothetical protein